MKYFIALLLGVVVGGALFVVGLIYNPFIGTASVSPLSFAENEQIVLSYSGIADESILFSNNGESRVRPHPQKVLQLWEAPIRQTSVMTTVIHDARNQVAGLGIKMSSLSEATDILKGEAMVDSVWYIYLAGRGSFFLEQRENRWSYMRDVVVSAYRNSGNTWKGVWNGNITAGPGALGTAEVTGGFGDFAGQTLLGVESLSVRAWSAGEGALSAQGTLTLEFSAATSSNNNSGLESPE